MDYKVILLILAGLAVLYFKYKDLFFSARDKLLTKEGEQLNTEAEAIKARIRDLQAQQANPGKILSRDEIEEYWSKK